LLLLLNKLTLLKQTTLLLSSSLITALRRKMLSTISHQTNESKWQGIYPILALTWLQSQVSLQLTLTYLFYQIKIKLPRRGRALRNPTR
jgi:hypothetical protein